ncbi:MAG: hypothetical protein ABJG78_12640 [Cyclobacteriaceae bacterium]
MKLLLSFSLLLTISLASSQSKASFPVFPFAKGNTNVDNGLFELGLGGNINVKKTGSILVDVIEKEALSIDCCGNYEKDLHRLLREGFQPIDTISNACCKQVNFINDKDSSYHFPISRIEERGSWKIGVRVPALEDTKNTAQIDRNTDKHRFFIGVGYDIVRNENGGLVTVWNVSLVGETGKAKYTWFPDSTKSSKIGSKLKSNAFEIKTHFYIGRQGGNQWTFYGRFRQTDEYENSEKVGVVKPNPPTFSYVDSRIVSPPKNSRKISPAIGIQFYPGTDLPISYAPIYYFYLQDEDSKSDFERHRQRLESWIYYYPAETTNLRFGVAIFNEWISRGLKEDEKKRTIGGMLNFTFNVNMLTDLF